MAQKLFKTTLFGFSKKGVCEYISKAIDDLTRKHNNEKRALNDRIKALEEENARLREEKKQAEKQPPVHTPEEDASVSEIIIDARNFADNLKAKAEERYSKNMEDVSKQISALESEINEKRAEVEKIRAFLRSFLENADAQLGVVEKNLDSISTHEE